jgi:hypothetical protein
MHRNGEVGRFGNGESLVAAVNAGVIQAIARRGHEQIAGKCPSCGTEHK